MANVLSTPLRTPSARPEPLTDERGRRMFDPLTVSSPGVDAPFGRERVVYALPLRDGPVQLAPLNAVVGGDGNIVSGTLMTVPNFLIGEFGHTSDAVWVDRMVTATVTKDTRRL